MANFYKRLIAFKNVKPRVKKSEEEWIMKNVDELYEKYHYLYKSAYENDNEFNEDKKKNFDY